MPRTPKEPIDRQLRVLVVVSGDQGGGGKSVLARELEWFLRRHVDRCEIFSTRHAAVFDSVRALVARDHQFHKEA